MPKNKPNAGSSAGDWSNTGTFVRKPATGWLHRDLDLTDGAYVKYRLNYLGCAVVLESMKSLQYQVRTMATREGITRLAEQAQKLPVKKRKIPKQVTRLLGDTITRWAGEVNLCIDVDQLQLINVSSGREIMTHSLTTISFASGGDGVTQDFIGYVAKDPVNNRACHVFYCPGGTSQLVLATLGQAFELRYKMYLGSSPSQPQQPTTTSKSHLPSPLPPLPEPPTDRRSDSFIGNRYGNSSDPPPYSNSEYSDPLPPPLPPPLSAGSISPMNSHGKKRLPSEPPPLTEVTRQVQAPLPPPPSMPPRSLSRPRVYSSLPGFPEPDSGSIKTESPYEMEDDLSTQFQHRATLKDTTLTPSTQQWNQSMSRPLSYNPYDTMPDGCTLPGNAISRGNNHDDDRDHDYDSVHEEEEEEEEEEATYDIVEGYEDRFGKQIQRPIKSSEPHYQQQDLLLDVDPVGGTLDTEVPPITEEDYQLITIHQKPSVDIQDQIDLTPAQTPDINHVYSNLQEEMMGSPPRLPEADYDDPESLEILPIEPTRKGEYDDPDAFLQASLNMDDVDGPPPPYSGLTAGRNNATKNPSPAFDDSIYSVPQSEFIENEVDPCAPLHVQPYFHGRIARPNAESLMREDGDFLVRESTNKPGQYVLTGLSNGRPQHLLLIDKSGKVKSRDREFESVPHLVKFFYERATSLTIGNCEVFLSRPVPA